VWTLGKWEPSWRLGETGGPVRQEGERVGSWHQTAEEDRRYKMPQNIGDGLATTPSHVYAQSMIVRCALINTPTTKTGIMIYCNYLFQENKSCGSKKPFAFILWCMRSCVEHSKGFEWVA
jgi:hypothetical protein